MMLRKATQAITIPTQVERSSTKIICSHFLFMGQSEPLASLRERSLRDEALKAWFKNNTQEKNTALAELRKDDDHSDRFDKRLQKMNAFFEAKLKHNENKVVSTEQEKGYALRK